MKCEKSEDQPGHKQTNSFAIESELVMQHALILTEWGIFVEPTSFDAEATAAFAWNIEVTIFYTDRRNTAIIGIAQHSLSGGQFDEKINYTHVC